MVIYKKLYVGERARRKKYEILWKIKRSKIMPNVYVILISVHEGSLLEIIPSYVLLQSYYKKQKRLVAGIACGYREAVDTVQKIIMEVYENTGGCDVKQYLNNIQKGT